MIKCLENTQNVLTNIHFKNVVGVARDQVMKRIPLTEPLKQSEVFPPMVYHMSGIGEETGNLVDMLEKLTNYYDEEEVSNMMNLRKKAGNNKGFSLVELIIVIAILAILVGILAPQYIKYVEKSRKSTDVSNIDNFVSAVKVTAADTDYAKNLNGNTYTIAIAAAPAGTGTATTTVTATGTAAAAGDLDAAFNEALGTNWANTKLKSKSWGGPVTAVVKIGADGSVTATYTPTGVADALK